MQKTVFDKRSLLFFAYCMVVITTTFFHEWWRDEWNAVNLVVYSSGISDLIHLIRLEGHPPLWYFLIKICYSIYPDKWLVTALHLGIMLSAVWLLIYKVKWPFYLKALLVFNYFFVFEYAIPVRNYSLILLFALWLLVLWQHKCHFIWMLLPATGLIYSNVYGSIMLAGWGLFLLFEVWDSRNRIFEFLGFSAGVICLLVFYFLVFAPLGNKSVSQADFEVFRAVKVLPKGLAYLWNAFIPLPLFKVDFWNTNFLDRIIVVLSESYVMPANIVVVNYLIKAVLVLPLLFFILKPLWATKKVLFALLFSWLGMYLLQMYLYEGYLRHWGYYFIAYIFWLIVSEQKVPLLKYLLVLGVFSGFWAIAVEIYSPFSTAEQIAADIKNSKIAEEPVVMTTYSEIPSIAGYLNQPVYFPSLSDSIALVNWRFNDTIDHPTVVEEFCTKKGLLNQKNGVYLVVPASNSKVFFKFFSKKYNILLNSYPSSITSEDLSLIKISPRSSY